MFLLRQNELVKIHDAALKLSFGEKRSVLMTGIDVHLVQSIEKVGSPKDQLWLDITVLAQVPKQSDKLEEHPLVYWLKTAEHLAQPYEEAKIFGECLEKLRGNLSTRTSVAHGGGAGDSSFGRRLILPKPVFVGRKKELEQIRAALLPPSGLPQPVAILGPPGLGKTWLAEHFMAEHQNRFPGFRYRLVLRDNDQRSPAQCLGELSHELRLGVAPERQRHEVAKALRERKALLHIDNADTAQLAAMVSELVQGLKGVPILLTGRYLRLGEDRNSGWIRVLPHILSLDEARRLLEEELLGIKRRPKEEDSERLVIELGRLPLAIHLGAAHIKAGRSVDGFLEMLHQSRYELAPLDPSGIPSHERQRHELSASFSLSLQAFRRQVGQEGERLVSALRNLGWAPLGGFGPSLGMAITGLDELDFEELMVQARTLSMVDEMPVEEREDQAWSLHPLMAKWLALAGDKEAVLKRVGAWILERVPKNPQETRGARWEDLNMEAKGVRTWLEEGPFEMLEPQWAGIWIYASNAGGVEGWLEAVERTLPKVEDARKRSDLLWSLGILAFYSGMLDKAWEAVEQRMKLDREQGWEWQLAFDQDLQALILMERGQLEQALQLLREEVLPVNKRLGSKRDQAIALSRIADILRKQERLDEALSVLQEEALPLYREVGDQRELAAAMSNIALILSLQGKLDEAIEIRCRDVHPIYQQMGDGLGLLISRANLAHDLLERGHLQDRAEAQELLKQALAEAERMKVANKITWIRGIQKRYKLLP